PGPAPPEGERKARACALEVVTKHGIPGVSQGLTPGIDDRPLKLLRDGDDRPLAALLADEGRAAAARHWRRLGQVRRGRADGRRQALRRRDAVDQAGGA